MILLPPAAVLLLAAGMGRHPSAHPHAATGEDSPSGAAPARLEVHAVRLSAPVTIDGDLSDPGWQNIPAFTTFVQRDPVEGGAPSQRTEVQVAFDDAALYIAATMTDGAPDSIVARLSRRDDKPNSDLFGLYLGRVDGTKAKAAGPVLVYETGGRSVLLLRDADAIDGGYAPLGFLEDDGPETRRIQGIRTLGRDE